MNILFTCAGRRTYLLNYFRENLREGDLIIATDMQHSAPALQAADVKLQVPSIYDPDYVDITLRICREYKVNALISLNDLELPVLAMNKEKFKAIGTVPIISNSDVIDVCFDKYKTSKWIESIGLKSPRTFTKLNDVKSALANHDITFPLFMKPRWGSGSIGLEDIADMEELEVYYNLLLKKIKKSILKNVSEGDESILIQEKLVGEEYGLDVMNDLNGNNVGVSVKRKLAMRAGETDKAITVDLPEVREIGRKVGENLRHIGNLDMDIMQNSKGDYCVLELNPRFGGGFPFSYAAGVNYPKALIEWLQGNTVDETLLQPSYNMMFAKNDYLVKVN